MCIQCACRLTIQKRRVRLHGLARARQVHVPCMYDPHPLPVATKRQDPVTYIHSLPDTGVAICLFFALDACVCLRGATCRVCPDVITSRLHGHACPSYARRDSYNLLLLLLYVCTKYCARPLMALIALALGVSFRSSTSSLRDTLRLSILTTGCTLQLHSAGSGLP